MSDDIDTDKWVRGLEVDKLRTENAELRELCKAYQDLCCAYRLRARNVPEKALATIERFGDLLGEGS